MIDGTWVFCSALWLAILIKMGWDGIHGGLHVQDPGRYPRERLLSRPRHVQVALSPRAWRIWYGARWLALGFVAADVTVGAAWLLLALALFHEIVLDKKFHTQLLFISALWASLFEASIWRGITEPSEQIIATFTMAAVIVLIYWNSAVIKLRSPGFMSGDALRVALLGFSTEGPRTGLNEFMFGARFAHDQLARPWVRWMLMIGSRGAVAAEFAIPALLMTPATFVFGVTLGIALHLAFWVLLPLKLLPFQIAMLASYALFWNILELCWSI